MPFLEKEIATHSSVLAWRIPGTGEPGGLPALGSHRVGQDWSDLAAAAAAASCVTVAKLRYPLASHLFPKSTEYYRQAILQRKIIFCTFYWFVTESSPILENVPQKAAFEKWACGPMVGTLTYKTNANTFPIMNSTFAGTGATITAEQPLLTLILLSWPDSQKWRHQSLQRWNS